MSTTMGQKVYEAYELIKESMSVYPQFTVALEKSREKRLDIQEVLSIIKEFTILNKQNIENYTGSDSWLIDYNVELFNLANEIESISWNKPNEYDDLIVRLENHIIKGKQLMEGFIQEEEKKLNINIGSMKLLENTKENVPGSDINSLLDRDSMNDLEKYFFDGSHNTLSKWYHYFEIYDRHFHKYRNKPVIIMEIGVESGGSMQMWKNYFGPQCRIIGVDINENCRKFADDQIEIYIGSQEDRSFLKQLKEILPKVDILLDDGGHTMNQQIVTFEELYDQVADDGIYLCEDLHTSYWNNYDGGYGRRNSYIEYSKNFIDYLNAWHSTTLQLTVNNFTRSTHSLHYYDSMLVVEKRKMYPSQTCKVKSI